MSLLKKYPAFAYAALMAVRLAPDARTRKELKSLVAVNVGEETRLREILMLNSEPLASFYPDELTPQLSTDETISTFLDKFGSNLPSTPEGADPLLALAPAIPYVPGEDLPELSAEDPAYEIPIIAGPAKPEPAPLTPSSETPVAPTPAKPDSTPESPALTESFARILVKNGNYAKALAIIEDLNLKNPEKSIYFADQIRFLKKLMINQNKKS